MPIWLGLIVTAAYVFVVIGVAELLRRWRGWGNEFTRKVVHIGVGMLSWVIPFIFESPWPFVVACLAFAALNYLDTRHLHLFDAMASKDDESNLGTVYFPLAAAAVVLIFWNHPPVMVAALMPLTWGDGMAEVIGRKFGRNKYTIWGHTRSLEGSLAFIGFGAFFSWLALVIIPGAPNLTPLEAIIPALVMVTAAAIVEAISIGGLDNLTVTGTAILVFGVWLI
jgi:dolichol kinase